MITRLILENFMAHAHTEFELGPGLTVISGPNNTGKSAVVEALRCLAFNPTPKHVIRHGAKMAVVEAQLDTGERIRWIRKPRSPIYELYRPGAEEPEVFAKMGRGNVPDEIRDLLRLDLVDADTTEKIDVHVGNQREPIFMLNQPGSAMAAFLANASESAHLLAMQDALKNRAREAKRTAERERGRLTAIESELAGFTALPEIGLSLNAARELKHALDEQARMLPELEKRIHNLRLVLETRARLGRRVEVLAEAGEPPRLHETRRLADMLANRAGLAAAMTRAEATGSCLARMAAPPELFAAARLGATIARLTELRANRARAAARSSALDDLAQPPATHDTGRLEAVLSGLRVARRKREAAEQAGESLATLREPPSATDVSGLARLTAEMKGLAERREALARDVSKREAELSAMHERIERRLGAVGECPLCGSRMEAADFLKEKAS